MIAAVHGHCLGGGVDLLCACDIRIASTDAVFGIREVRVAFIADVGTLQPLWKRDPPLSRGGSHTLLEKCCLDCGNLPTDFARLKSRRSYHFF